MIYYVLSRRMNLIKIGHSANPKTRLQQIRVLVPDAELLTTEFGDHEEERQQHVRFADFRERGEWFHLAEPLLSHIEWLKKGRPCPPDCGACLALANGHQCGTCSACGRDYFDDSMRGFRVRPDGLCEGCVRLPALVL